MRAFTKISTLLLISSLMTLGCGGGSSDEGPGGTSGTGGTAGTGGVGGDGGNGGDPGSRFAQLSAAQDHTCGLFRDGSVDCWGTDAHGDEATPIGFAFEAIETATNYTCAIKSEETLECWGEGQGTQVPNGELFESIALGFDHACGLRV
ncbi:MAG: hypothetical protein ACN4G0_10545, partial [Polyangiales bacterium]